MGIRPYILAETNWKELQHKRFELAVLPWGATEAHNFHLPYGTDIYESDYIAAEAARLAWEKGGKVIVLPSIPFGVNTGQADVYLDINLNPTTQLAILDDVAATLQRVIYLFFQLVPGHGKERFLQGRRGPCRGNGNQPDAASETGTGFA
jgi:creatinine amidohydrolase